MNTHIDTTQNKENQSIANAVAQKKSDNESGFQFVDNRPETVTQRKFQEMTTNSPRAIQLKAFHNKNSNSSQAEKTIQLLAMMDSYSIQQQPIQKKENNTGLPDNLKTGIENLSGYAMDDVNVHYNSDKPAQLQAHAYAQGTDIHLASGQEKHLPHEAWHVVQQKQGRVKATMQMKGHLQVNDDIGLEKEADEMGQHALQFKTINHKTTSLEPATTANSELVIQRFQSIRFANVDMDDPKYQSKADDLIEILQNTPVIMHYLRDKNALITLEEDPDNLASVIEKGEQVQITLAPWFFEQQSRGKIVALLAHEFGIHPLADDLMSEDEIGNEKGLVYAPETEDAHATLGTPMDTGLNDDTVVSNDTNQDDHLFGSIEGNPRMNHYRQTLFDMINAMAGKIVTARGNDTQIDLEDQHITDAIFAYFSDMATILATNDRRQATKTNARRAARYFNYLRTNWLAWLGSQEGDHIQELIQLTPQVQGTSGFGVIKKMAGLAGRYFILSKFTNSTSDTKFQQGATGITTIQEEVLGDFGLHLQPMGFGDPSPTCMQALDTILRYGDGGASGDIQFKISRIQPHQDIETNTNLTNLNQALIDGTLSDPISSIDLRYISRLIGDSIRIIRPNGKMENYGNQGNTLNLLEVEEPSIHYRYAT